MNTNKNMDERQKKLSTQSMAVAGFVAYFYGIFMFIAKLIRTKDFKNVYFEFGLVVMMTITIFVYRMANKDYDIPTTIGGRQLPTGNTKEDKNSRMFYYIRDSLSFTVIMTFFNYKLKGAEGLLFEMDNSYLGFILHGTLLFIIWLFINYLWHEWNIKKYNAYCKSLEEEIEDDNYEDDGHEYKKWIDHDIFKPLEDQIEQIKCPSCGKSHDIDYPKCPFCKYDYYSKKE